ncbi:MAG: hypothetical protein GW855_07935 [Erythrobacter sp.]|nr:hypothetical protein [Erythrobacter sp.]NCQ62468.1 hypothetical protein [Alphaproteobacteria bacterium]
MTLRTALIVSGDTESAQRAVGELNASMAKAEAQAEETGREWTKASVGLERLERAQEQAAREGISLSQAQQQAAMQGRDWRASIDQTSEALVRQRARGRENVVSLGAQRAGMQQLAFQLGDVATMFSMGARPMQIFASQGGQVVQAIGLMRGGAGGLIGFLGGPWGIGIMAAVTALTPFISKLFESEDAIDAVGESLRGMETDADRAVAALQRLDSQRQTSLQSDIVLAEYELTKRRDKLSELQGRPELPEGGGFGDERSRARRAAIVRQRTEEERQLQWDIVELQGRINIGRNAVRRMEAAEAGTDTNRTSSSRAPSSGTSGGRSGGVRSSAPRLSEEARARKAANDNTLEYIAGLREEIEAIGLDEKALRQLEIQRAKESAVTSEQVATIDELNQKRERAIDLEESRQRANTLRDETEDINGSIAALEREAQAIGLVGWERERLLMVLANQAQMDALLADLARAKASGTQEEVAAIRAQIDALQTRNSLEVQMGDASEVHRAQSEAAERTAGKLSPSRTIGRRRAGRDHALWRRCFGCNEAPRAVDRGFGAPGQPAGRRAAGRIVRRWWRRRAYRGIGQIDLRRRPRERWAGLAGPVLRGQRAEHRAGVLLPRRPRPHRGPFE